MNDFRAPFWLPGGHAQTIWPALTTRRLLKPVPPYQRERWDTPDGDFVDVDFLHARDPKAPWLVMFHGLEGDSGSHYALAFAAECKRRGWTLAIPHFRGCSGELNRAPRAYHSGDFAEVGWVLARLRQRAPAPLFAVGISLGGNALLRWAEESGSQAAAVTCGLAAVCAPIDLSASGHAIGRGLNRQIYTRMFLRSMKPKALRKLAQFPGLFDRERLLRAVDLYEFDNLFTAPLHGFRDTEDYWRRASALPRLREIRIPALALNARNDPFVPPSCLPTQVPGSYVELWQPEQGGHVGFPSGLWPGHVQAMPQAVGRWLAGLGG